MATTRPVLSFLNSVKHAHTGRTVCLTHQLFYMQRSYSSIFTHIKSGSAVKVCDLCRRICFSAVTGSDDARCVSNVNRISEQDNASSKTNGEFSQTQDSTSHTSDLIPEDTFGLLSQRRHDKSSTPRNFKKGHHAEAAYGTRRLVLPVEAESTVVSGARDTHWADMFGTLTEDAVSKSKEEHTDSEEEEVYRRRPLSSTGQKHSPQWYGRQIEKLGKHWKVKEAIEILEFDMLQRDRVMPTPYVFTVLLGVLGRSGYTKKAFQLFNKMKKMGLQPEDATYTALFNACGNSPWSHDGLSRAHKLYELMMEQGVQPNLINYKAMMKAFGVCGDLRMTFRIMDQLTQHFRPDCESFSFLLMACISDKLAGFRHAIQVWQLMKLNHVQPDLPLYNLFLRVTRDCAFNRELLLDNSSEIPSKPEPAFSMQHALSASSETSSSLSKQNIPVCDDSSFSSHAVQVGAEARDGRLSSDSWWQNGTKCVEAVTSDDSVSNCSLSVITQQLNVGEDSTLDVCSLNKAEHRLDLLGGFRGWLTSMEEDCVKPDVKIFMQLLDFSSSLEAEEELLGLMDKNGVKPDIDLLNNLIHKRCMKQEFQHAQDVLQLIEKHGLQANMRTFCCLAMTCKKKGEGQRLLKDLENVGLVPNIEVLGTLVYASRMDFHYKLEVIKYCDMLNLKPNSKFLENAEKSIAAATAALVRVEKDITVGSYFRSEYFQSGFKNFMIFYRPWLQRTELEKPNHPWKTFRNSK